MLWFWPLHKPDCEHTRTMLEQFAESVETGWPWVVSEQEAVANTALLEAIAYSVRNADGKQIAVGTSTTHS